MTRDEPMKVPACAEAGWRGQSDCKVRDKNTIRAIFEKGNGSYSKAEGSCINQRQSNLEIEYSKNHKETG